MQLAIWWKGANCTFELKIDNLDHYQITGLRNYSITFDPLDFVLSSVLSIIDQFINLGPKYLYKTW